MTSGKDNWEENSIFIWLKTGCVALGEYWATKGKILERISVSQSCLHVIQLLFLHCSCCVGFLAYFKMFVNYSLENYECVAHILSHSAFRLSLGFSWSLWRSSIVVDGCLVWPSRVLVFFIDHHSIWIIIGGWLNAIIAKFLPEADQEVRAVGMLFNCR